MMRYSTYCRSFIAQATYQLASSEAYCSESARFHQDMDQYHVITCATIIILVTHQVQICCGTLVHAIIFTTRWR